jgi:glycosyltransferase involved in cell wall biosynthesis
LTIVGPAHPLRGGIAHHVHAIQKLLTERGHSLQVISFKKLYPGFLFPGKTVLDVSEMKLDASAAPILDPLNPVTWGQALFQIQKFRPEAVVLQWWNPYFAPVSGTLARILRAMGARLIGDCHNVFPHERSIVDLPLVWYALGAIDRFVVHSSSVRTELQEVKPDARVRTVPLSAVSQFRGRARTDRNCRKILFFGLVREYKGLDVLLEAIPEVLNHLDCELVIAGEFYHPLENYKALIRKLEIERAVRIDNRYIPNEEVAKYFESADVLVMPYRSATQSGIARIAAINGLPIIGTRVGGLAEAVRDGVDGLLIPPEDPKALARALVRYFESGLGPIFAQKLLSSAEDDPRASIVSAIEDLAS